MQRTNRSIWILVALLVIPSSHAQESIDLVGTWSASYEYPDPRMECGRIISIGEVWITEQITEFDYRGKMFVDSSSEKCARQTSGFSNLSIEVRGTEVTLVYDRGGATSDVLQIDGEVMTNESADGHRMRFVKLSPWWSEETTEEEIEKRLERWAIESMENGTGGSIMKALLEIGKSETEARSIAIKTAKTMNKCMYDRVAPLAAENSIAPKELLYSFVAVGDRLLVRQDRNELWEYCLISATLQIDRN